MSAFSGFLSGFSQVGSEIIQREDQQQQRINEIVAQGEQQIKVNNARIEADAKARLELQRMQQQQQMELLQASGLLGGAAPSILQTEDSEVDIEEGEVAPTSTPSAFSGVSGTIPPITPLEIVAPSSAAAAAVRQQRQTQIQDERAAKAEEARNARFERQLEEGRRKELNAEWLKETQNKDSTYYKAKAIMPTIEASLTDLDNAEKANNKLNMGENDLMRAVPIITTKEAKALEMQKVEGALAKVQQTVGAISNAEMELFGDASISPNNDRQTNANLIAKNRAIQIRAKQYFEFMNEARKTGISVTDAQLRWVDFVDQTPMLKQTSQGKIELVAPVSELKKDKSWREYITGSPEQNTFQQPSSQKEPSSQTNSFDEWLNSLGDTK